MLVALAALLYVLVGHAAHAEEPALEKEPATQGVQAPDPAGEKDPAPQVWQDDKEDDCARVEYVPLSQAAQMVDPVCE